MLAFRDINPVARKLRLDAGGHAFGKFDFEMTLGAFHLP
jgi:hypothetical protein